MEAGGQCMTDEQVKLTKCVAISLFHNTPCDECPIRGNGRCHDGCAESFARWLSSGEINDVCGSWGEYRTLEQMFEDGDDP